MNTNKTNTLMPFFSIIVTTYNRAKLLTRALDSLIAQTTTDWEVILVDDGSTDNTYAAILPYLKAHPKIKYVLKEHSGEVYSKNEGIRASQGKYITFLDSDDAYDPTHLENRKHILTQNPEVKFLYGGVHVLGNQFVPDRFDHSKSIHLNDCVIGGSFFVEKEVFHFLNGLKQMPLGTDADLFDRAQKAGVRMMEAHAKTYIYHHENQDSITNKMYLRV
ncbi:glycosyltransferase family 2 protein [Mariniflexile ostreae]|uniref:Glycosyltransferase family 2 protein n=1 Tax=Mariniflexile ostreae TaxID=1520892 RepID=A0ABV5F6X0_9FLAO